MLKYSLAVLLGLLFLQPDAQEVKPLLLKDALEAGLKNNRTVGISVMEEQIARAKYKETEAVYLPQLAFSYTALTTNNPLNAFGFKLQQKTITQNDFNPDLLNHPSGTPDFMTKLELQQPVINMDMVYMRKAAHKETEIYQYKTQRTKEYISFEIEKAYLQLSLAYDAVKVLEESVTTARQVAEKSDNYARQGLVQQSDVLNAKVFVATMETSLTAAKSNIANAADYLGLLMGKEPGIIYTVTANDYLPVVSDSSYVLNDNRADFLAMQRGLEASDLMIQSAKKRYLPTVNAFGSYQLNDAAVLGFGANAYLAGIQLSWNIFKGNSTKNAIVTQSLERNKLSEELKQQKDQSRLELNKAVRDLNDTRASMVQNKLAVEQAAEALRILQNRYAQGLVPTTDVLLAANQLSRQQLNYQQSLCNLQVTAAYLQLLTSSNTK